MTTRDAAKYLGRTAYLPTPEGFALPVTIVDIKQAYGALRAVVEAHNLAGMLTEATVDFARLTFQEG